MCKSDKAAQVCISVAANVLTGCPLACECVSLTRLTETIDSRLGVWQQVDMNEDSLYVPRVKSEVEVPRHVPSQCNWDQARHTAERLPLVPKVAVRVETGME